MKNLQILILVSLWLGSSSVWASSNQLTPQQSLNKLMELREGNGHRNKERFECQEDNDRTHLVFDGWAWMGGSPVIDQAGIYQTQGIGSTSNIPGSRFASASWTDQEGNFWIFGGFVYSSDVQQTVLNDLWKYNPNTKKWTFVSGNTLGGSILDNGVYGTQGVGSTANMPSGRWEPANWVDEDGNLWLFGGIGIDVAGNFGFLNDLWKYDIQRNEWTWITGSNISTWGTVDGISNAGNVPVARLGASSWSDKDGNFYLFGGFDNYGYANNGWSSAYMLNDLWKYTPTEGKCSQKRPCGPGTWTMISGSNIPNQPGIYGIENVGSKDNTPGARWFPSTWTDEDGKFWLFGGLGYNNTNPGKVYLLADMWNFNPRNKKWTWVSGSGVSESKVGVYGTMGVPDPANIPGGRTGGPSWIDQEGNMWLLGGIGHDVTTVEDDLNDLWRYTPGRNCVAGQPCGVWTWMSGSSIINPLTTPAYNEIGTFGTLGIPSVANNPGGREQTTAAFSDRKGNLWLFGGVGYDGVGGYDYLNDFWMFDIDKTHPR